MINLTNISPLQFVTPVFKAEVKFYIADGGSKFLRNFRKFLSIYTASYPAKRSPVPDSQEELPVSKSEFLSFQHIEDGVI